MASRVSVQYCELTCSICWEVFKDPRILSCAHSFCFCCLEEWTKTSTDFRNLSCPLCKDTTHVPSGGITRLRSNYFLADLVRRLNKASDKICCTDDCTRPAVQYCIDGCGYLCGNCCTQHGKFKGNKSHNVVGAEVGTDLEMKHSAGFCSVHPDERLHLYCRDCKLASCSKCLSVSHKRHHLVDLTEQAHLSRDQLHTIMKQTDVLIKIKLINEQVSDRQHHHLVTLEDADTKQQINRIIDGMITKLSKKRNKIFKSLNQIKRQNSAFTFLDLTDAEVIAADRDDASIRDGHKAVTVCDEEDVVIVDLHDKNVTQMVCDGQKDTETACDDHEVKIVDVTSPESEQSFTEWVTGRLAAIIT